MRVQAEAAKMQAQGEQHMAQKCTTTLCPHSATLPHCHHHQHNNSSSSKAWQRTRTTSMKYRASTRPLPDGSWNCSSVVYSRGSMTMAKPRSASTNAWLGMYTEPPLASMRRDSSASTPLHHRHTTTDAAVRQGARTSRKDRRATSDERGGHHTGDRSRRASQSLTSRRVQRTPL
jgi:hypothetical protein